MEHACFEEKKKITIYFYHIDYEAEKGLHEYLSQLHFRRTRFHHIYLQVL